MQNEIKKSDSIQLKNVQKDKNTRQHIRLRPRQMLCSKCKAMCQETDKGIVPITAVPKQGTKSEIIFNFSMTR
jgi:NMD protein affecting ribosome stability and mRNA decay